MLLPFSPHSLYLPKDNTIVMIQLQLNGDIFNSKFSINRMMVYIESLYTYSL